MFDFIFRFVNECIYPFLNIIHTYMSWFHFNISLSKDLHYETVGYSFHWFYVIPLLESFVLQYIPFLYDCCRVVSWKIGLINTTFYIVSLFYIIMMIFKTFHFFSWTLRFYNRFDAWICSIHFYFYQQSYKIIFLLFMVILLHYRPVMLFLLVIDISSLDF